MKPMFSDRAAGSVMDLFELLDVRTIQRLGCLRDHPLPAEVYYRERIQLVWDLVSKPLKFPSRRRRGDREVPKAA